jgi:hypothetical protein
MAAADLTEHGGSVWGSWLTDKGRDLLEYLEGNEEDDWMEPSIIAGSLPTRR